MNTAMKTAAAMSVQSFRSDSQPESVRVLAGFEAPSALPSFSRKGDLSASGMLRCLEKGVAVSSDPFSVSWIRRLHYRCQPCMEAAI